MTKFDRIRELNIQEFSEWLAGVLIKSHKLLTKKNMPITQALKKELAAGTQRCLAKEYQ